MALQIYYGNAVSGDQRYSRAKLEKKLMSKLLKSAGIKMFGLRRIGKSTARLFVCEQLSKQNIAYVYFDAQGMQSIEDMLLELFTTLHCADSDIPNKVVSYFKDKGHPVRRVLESLITGSKTGERLTEALWQETFKAIKVGIENTEEPFVLVIDEFSFLLRNILKHNKTSGLHEVDCLLSGMREWRDNGMKMFLTGSIGVTALSRKYQFDADHLNDLQAENIPELTAEEARDFVEQATEQNRDFWDTEIVDEFLNQSGVYYPSFLVKGIMDVDIEQPTLTDLPAFFANEVRPNLHNDFYLQFNKRFKLYEEVDKKWQQKLVVPILKKVLSSDEPVDQKDIKASRGYNGVDIFNALNMLEEDGFVTFIENEAGYRVWKPASRLVKLWFKRTQ